MGNFSGQTVMGKTGSSLPAWVAKSVLDFLEEKNPVHEPFPQPENWAKAKICPLSGMPASEACPSFVFEYLPKGQAAPECGWHKTIDGGRETVYPPEYQRWLLANNLDARVDHSSAPLKITTPKDGSVFYKAASSAQEQAIWVEAVGGEKDSADVYLDGAFLFAIERPFVFKLAAEKGKKTCKLVCSSESAAVAFEVK